MDSMEQEFDALYGQVADRITEAMELADELHREAGHAHSFRLCQEYACRELRSKLNEVLDTFDIDV